MDKRLISVLGPHALPKMGILTLLTAYLISAYPIQNNNIAGGWGICIDLLMSGSLYGGQAYCNQAPAIYYVGAVFSLIFGSNLIYLPFMILKICCFAFILAQMIRYSRHLGTSNQFLEILLFLLIIYPLGFQKPEVLMSTVFFLAGFSTQFLKDNRGNLLVSGFFYGLALLFKYTVIYAFFISSAYLIVACLKSGKRSSALFDLFRFILPTILLALLLYAIHPNFITYSVTSHLIDPAISLEGAFQKVISPGNIHGISIIFFVIVGMIRSISLRDNPEKQVFLVYPLWCIPLITLSLTRANGIYQDPSYYVLTFLVILIPGIQIFKDMRHEIFILILTVVLVYPGMVGGSLVGQKRQEYRGSELKDLKKLVFSGISMLPPSREGLLFESGLMDFNSVRKLGLEDFFADSGWEVKGNHNFMIPPDIGYAGGEDPFWGPRIRKVINITHGQNTISDSLSEEEMRIRDELLAQKYDTVLITAQSWVTLTKIFQSIGEENVSSRYCELYIPDLSQLGRGRFFSVILYSDPSVCKPAAKRMALYYVDIFDQVCEQSKTAAVEIYLVNAQNGFAMKKVCENKSDLLDEDTSRVDSTDLLFFILAASTSILLTSNNVKKKKKKV